MTLFRNPLRRKETIPTPTRPIRTMLITRRFVETGDERCPLAGIWMPLNDSSAVSEDSELLRPVIGKLLLGGPFISLLHSLRTVTESLHDRCLRHLAVSHLSSSFSALSA